MVLSRACAVDVSRVKARVTISLLMAGPVLLCPHASGAAQPRAKYAVEGQSYILVQTDLSGPAVGGTDGQGFSLGTGCVPV